MNHKFISLSLLAKILTGVVVVLLFASACAPAATPETPMPTPTSEIGTPVVVYHREGGIAGFCDDVLIDRTGKAKITSCKFTQEKEITLTAAQSSTINQWLAAYKGFEYQHTDPATADAMTITLKFSGDGPSQPGDAEIQSMLSFLSQIAVQ